MVNLPALVRLSECLAKLPGIGRRTAEKMAVRLLKKNDSLLSELIEALRDAEKNIDICNECGGLTLKNENPCKLCLSANRDDRYLCVVEEPSDILLLERAGEYAGRYHVLMGKLSPGKGYGPSDINIDSLIKRITKGKFEEVILALSTDMEGDATAELIKEKLKNFPIRVSRLASGIPAGSGLAYSDPVTLARAVKWRVTEKQ